MPRTPERIAEFRRQFQADLSDPRHGTVNGYTNGRCRCLRCLEAGREYHRNDSYARKERAQETGVPEHLHGTWNAYSNWGCRCSECFEAGQRARLRWASTGTPINADEIPRRQIPLNVSSGEEEM